MPTDAESTTCVDRGDGCPYGHCPLLELVDQSPQDAEFTSWAVRWRLSPRHARVALLMMQALTDRQIGEQLGLATSTVRTYVRDVYGLTGAHNRAELLQLVLGKRR